MLDFSRVPGFASDRPLGSGPWSRYAAGRRESDGARVLLGIIDDVPLDAADALAARIRAIASPDPRLLAPIDAGADSEGVWYVCPRVAPSIAELVRDGTLATDEVSRLGIAAVRALEALEPGRGHGAIAPPVIQWDGTDVHIADAGVAELASVSGARPAAAGAAYRAPETLSVTATPAQADMFSLGAVLYTALTGKPPFGGRTTATVMATVLSDGPAEDVAGQPPSGHVVDSILRAIEKAPDDRWPTLDAFAIALGGGRPTTPPRAEAVAKRGPGCLGTAVFIVAATGALVAVS